MRDKAELTDRAEQLEHIVLQLQGETDTIGKSMITVYKSYNMVSVVSVHVIWFDDYYSDLENYSPIFLILFPYQFFF